MKKFVRHGVIYLPRRFVPDCMPIAGAGQAVSFLGRERERQGGGTGYAPVAPALSAHGYISVVASDFHLRAFVYDVPVAVYACVDYCLVSAGAG